MTFSKVASGTTPYGTKVPKSNPRRSKIDMFIVHHAATTSDKGLLSIFAQDGGRGTSANYAVLRDGTVIGAVPEELRAWTSGGKRDGATIDGSVFDHRAITVETVNNAGAPSWTISPAAFESLARLIEDCSRRYGFPLNRNHVVGHGELLKRFSASYATACPGGISVDALVARANAIRSSSNSIPATGGTEKPTTPRRRSPNMLLVGINSNGHPENGRVYLVAPGKAPKWIETPQYLDLLLNTFETNHGYRPTVRNMSANEAYRVFDLVANS